MIDLGKIDTDNGDKSAQRLIREGFSLWKAMGRDEATFRTAKAHWQVPHKKYQLKSISTDNPTEWRNKGGVAWQLIPRSARR